jgi:outer membrane protein
MRTAASTPTRRSGIWAAPLLLLALAVHAQENLVQQAKGLLDTGQGIQAYQLLEPEEVRYAGDLNFDLTLGIAANEAAQFPRAIIALERVLTVDPGNERARAEMGRALYGVGDNKAARALLSESMTKGFVSVAGEGIEQLLHAIDRVEAEGLSSAKGYVEMSAGYDTNINSAPGLSNVAVPAYGGSILAVDPAGARQKGNFWGLGGGASGRLVVDSRWSWIGTAAGRLQSFGGHRQLDNRQFDANGGVSYRVERHEYTLVAQGGIYDIDNQRVRNQWGAVGEWTYRFDGFRQLNTYFQTGRLSYPQQHIADVNRHVVGLTYAHLTRSGIWAYGGAYAGREVVLDQSVPHLGHHVWGARAGVQFPVAGSLGAFAAAGYEARTYGGEDPLFLVRRHDRQSNVSGGLSWIPAPLWRLTSQVSYARTDSDIVLAKYSKTALSVAARREF